MRQIREKGIDKKTCDEQRKPIVLPQVSGEKKKNTAIVGLF